ncbi:putative ABC exporter domain-containing protein [Sedimentibacter sp. zth1]|uniref:putative ABC exporter domain-containing protein n=1 Tax=Sedimentibacter sp. zth1 TaxID=2816908 RepID=UPI001A914B91|nr:putative ABC exporter domain-containing protein [Sedimentibacter sp. zth1]
MTRIKNMIKDCKKHPSRLILLLFFIAMMVIVIIGAYSSPTEVNELRDINEIFAIVFAFYGFLFCTTIMIGFSSGASFFKMADINLLFQTPISTKRILIYGLFRQLGTSIWVGFFIFFQYSILHNTYGINFLGLLSIFIGYCLIFFCSQLTAMAIYSYTCNDDKKKKILKSVIIGVLSIILLYIFKDLFFTSTNKLQAIVSSVNAKWLNFIPIIGWLKAFVVGIISGDIIYLIGGILATLAYVALFVYIVSTMNSDYYEDVLQATEVSYSAITAAKEGKIKETPHKVKTGKTGLKRGNGSNVFFYKHMLEDRRSGIFLLDRNSLIFIVVCIGFGFFTKESGSILPAFAFATYMQLLTSSLGRWVRELIYPYIYLIPDNAFKKLICITKENMLKIVLEAILIFVPLGIILNASALDVLACILARIGFGMLFMAGNILIERLFGQIVNKTLIIFLYFIVMIVLMLPGVLAGVFLALRFSEELIPIIVMGCMFIWNVIVASVITYFCKDILNYAELNNR